MVLSFVSSINLFVFLTLFYKLNKAINIGNNQDLQKIPKWIQQIVLRLGFLRGNDLVFVWKDATYIQVGCGFVQFLFIFTVGSFGQLMLILDGFLQTRTYFVASFLLLGTVWFVTTHGLAIYFYRRVSLIMSQIKKSE